MINKTKQKKHVNEKILQFQYEIVVNEAVCDLKVGSKICQSKLNLRYFAVVYDGIHTSFSEQLQSFDSDRLSRFLLYKGKLSIC